MILIADSSALIALSTVGKLEILEMLFGQVYVPRAVYDEVSKAGKPESKSLSIYCANRVVDVGLDLQMNVTLGLGESEAMALYKEKNADFLLCDDKKAKKFAQNFGIRVIGSLGVLLKAKEKKLISEVAPLIDKLKKSQVFIDDKTCELILEIAGETQSHNAI